MVGMGNQSKKDSKKRDLRAGLYGANPSTNRDRGRDLVQGPPAPPPWFKVVFSNFKVMT